MNVNEKLCSSALSVTNPSISTLWHPYRLMKWAGRHQIVGSSLRKEECKSHVNNFFAPYADADPGGFLDPEGGGRQHSSSHTFYPDPYSSIMLLTRGASLRACSRLSKTNINILTSRDGLYCCNAVLGWTKRLAGSLISLCCPTASHYLICLTAIIGKIGRKYFNHVQAL